MKNVNSLISGQISTEEEALIAVEEHPDTLSYIPEILRTENVIYAALIQKADLFKLADDSWFTPSLIHRLLTAKPPTREFIPVDLLTHDIYLKQVSDNGMWLQHVPTEFRTLEICLTAIESNVNAHEFVPNEIQKKEYLDKLIIIDPQKLVDVSVENRSPFVVLRLLENDHTVIRHVPSDYRTKEMCLKAMAVSIDAIRWFPEEIYLDNEVFEQIKNHDYFEKELEYDPHYMRPALVDYFIEKDVVKYFERIPMSTMTAEHCVTAVKALPKLVRLCPKHIRKDYNLWDIALTSDSSLLRTIPQDEKTGAIEVLGKNIKSLTKKETLFSIIVNK